MSTVPRRASFAAAAVLAAAGPLGIQSVLAQTHGADEVPRMANGHPDLTGVWWGGADVGGPGFFAGQQHDEPPVRFGDLYQPWAKEHAATLRDGDDPSLRCVPAAFGSLDVRLWAVGAVGQIISAPDWVVLLSETFHTYQVVPTDGRARRETVPPSYRGDAIGHWEGDTLVVEVENFTDDTWIYAQGEASFHSDELRIVERYRRVDRDTLLLDTTVYDPKVLTEPFVVPTKTLRLAPFDQLFPLDCYGTDTPDYID